jgi:hypothetical protein
MLLEIDDSKKLEDLQDRFNFCFPKLKIEFYRERHHWQELSAHEELLSPHSIVGDVRKVHDPGVMAISLRDRVGEVEKRFREQFGLNVQIFFFSHGRWIQTGTTDSSTLAELQNRQEDRMSDLIL